MSMTALHDRLATAIILYLIILLFWGFWRSLRKLSIDGNFGGALVVAEILVLVQGILGVILVITGLTPERGGIHFLYGVVGALGIPFIFAFNKLRKNQGVMLISTAILLFTAVIFFRSFVTG